MSEKHIFAVHVQGLPAGQGLSVGNQFTLSNAELWHRLGTVLHLKTGDEFIAFDAEQKLTLILLAFPKKNSIACQIKNIEPVVPLVPKIHLFQGLLKREAFNDVMYLSAQMGVTQVTPLITQKVQRSWGGQKEAERLEKVMIAGCEQAKQYVLPILNDPLNFLSLQLAMQEPETLSLFCEPTGKPFIECLQALATKKYSSINIFIGPEGGFTLQEQELLRTANIQAYALTNSILRSQEAVAVCVGAIRSVA